MHIDKAWHHQQFLAIYYAILFFGLDILAHFRNSIPVDGNIGHLIHLVGRIDHPASF
jgi:hypothetical protein